MGATPSDRARRKRPDASQARRASGARPACVVHARISRLTHARVEKGSSRPSPWECGAHTSQSSTRAKALKTQARHAGSGQLCTSEEDWWDHRTRPEYVTITITKSCALHNQAIPSSSDRKLDDHRGNELHYYGVGGSPKCCRWVKNVRRWTRDTVGCPSHSGDACGTSPIQQGRCLSTSSLCRPRLSWLADGGLWRPKILRFYAFEFDGAVQQLRTGALYMKQVAVVLGCRPSERAWPPDDGGNLGL